MNQLEENVISSFSLAKSDIIKLQNNFLKLSQAQKSIIESIDALKVEEAKLKQLVYDMRTRLIKKPVVQKTIVKSVGKRAHKHYVATKSGKNFHSPNCPFAQNIKPKNKVKFESKTKALNEGYKACNCIK